MLTMNPPICPLRLIASDDIPSRFYYLNGNTNNIIEAFFDIPPPSRDMEPLRAAPWGSQGPKKFFKFFYFSLLEKIDISIEWKPCNNHYFRLFWVYQRRWECFPSSSSCRIRWFLTEMYLFPFLQQTNNLALAAKKWFLVKERPPGKFWNKENVKNWKKNFGPSGPPGLCRKGPHISARGWNIKKTLDDVICIPAKVVHANSAQ